MNLVFTAFNEDLMNIYR